MDVLFLILGILLILKASDMLVDGCVNLAKFLRIPTLVIGLTIVAIATGVPEIAISITSSLKGANDLLLGNLIGSNMFNVLFILGLLGLIKPFNVKKEVVFKNYLFALLSCLVLFVVSSDMYLENNVINIITRSEGILLFCFSLIFTYSNVLSSIENKKENNEKIKLKIKDIFNIIFGVILIGLSASVIVDSVMNISDYFNISNGVIGLTVIAIGTNLPELITSIVATKKGEVDIAIGNLIGTNIYNIFLILGLSSFINPIIVSNNSFIDIILLTIVSCIVYIFIQNKKDINKKEGLIMIVMYVIYLIYVIA